MIRRMWTSRHKGFHRAIAAFASCLGVWLFPGASLAAEAVPGKDLVVTLPLVPLAFGYDINNNTLYTIASGTDGFIFGSVDPATGNFTQIPANSTINIGELQLGVPLTIDSFSHRLLVDRNDGLVSASEDGSSVIVNPKPTPRFLEAYNYDSQSNMMLGRAGSGVVSFSVAAGAESVETRYPFGGAVVASISAIDPQRHVFYVEEPGSNEANAIIDAISESTGAVRQITIPKGVFGLAYDYSKGALFGVTNCCGTGLPSTNEFVQIIIPKTGSVGTEKVISSVGNEHKSFNLGSPSTIDDNDLFSATYVTTTLVSADVAAARSWYVEVKKDETLADLNTWMTSAGTAEGQRALNAPIGQTLNVILEFGRQKTSFDQQTQTTIYGTTGYNHFLANSDIEMAILNYAQGFVSATASQPTAKINIVIGTQNFQKSNKKFGAAWSNLAQLVANDLATANFSSQISVTGGIDMELEFSPPAPVYDWVAGYGTSLYADFGDATDCTTTSTGCLPGWMKSDLSKLSGGYVMPEIYNTLGHSADEWTAVSLSNPAHLLKFSGPLTQTASCRQLPGSCTGTNNTPAAAWVQLTNDLTAAFGAGGTQLAPSSDFEHRMP